jgi:ATP-dependent Clp protease adapter protein ClpS
LPFLNQDTHSEPRVGRAALTLKRHPRAIVAALSCLGLGVLIAFAIAIRGMPAIIMLAVIAVIGLPAFAIAIIAEHRRFRRAHLEAEPLQRRLAEQSGYRLVILNDDRTPATFVVKLLRRFFGHDQDEAIATMAYIHMNGEGIGAVYDSEEQGHTKVEELRAFTSSYDYPLKFEIRNGAFRNDAGRSGLA